MDIVIGHRICSTIFNLSLKKVVCSVSYVAVWLVCGFDILKINNPTSTLG